jgi:hypothetical protein
MKALKPGDRVTLSREGQALLTQGKFPHLVKSIYVQILKGGGEVLKVEGNIVRIKILNALQTSSDNKAGLQGSPGTENNYGIPRASLTPLERTWNGNG